MTNSRPFLSRIPPLLCKPSHPARRYRRRRRRAASALARPRRRNGHYRRDFPAKPRFYFATRLPAARLRVKSIKDATLTRRRRVHYVAQRSASDIYVTQPPPPRLSVAALRDAIAIMTSPPARGLKTGPRRRSQLDVTRRGWQSAFRVSRDFALVLSPPSRRRPGAK